MTPTPCVPALPSGRSKWSPGRSNRHVTIEKGQTPYKQRYRIERMFGHLKVNRTIFKRCDQLANSFLGMVHLATTGYWLKFVSAA
ncbi:putative transposase [Sphingobium sp. SYK-6]|nr:putative transposase [Sphingobium sp. SYK-6]